MKIAFAYAGQGSQKVGMGRDLYEAEPAFRAAFDLLPDEWKHMAFEGPLEDLSQTANTQPVMVAFAAGVTAVLKEHGEVPTMATGLSLGEYSALQAAGVFDTKTVIDLVRFRGEQMAAAVGSLSCGMTAVMHIDRDVLSECCREASGLGIVTIANYNCPGQLVIGGERQAVARAAELAIERGAKRCVPLNVSGPFHTPLMRAAGDALGEKLKTVSLGTMDFPVLFNCTARPLSGDEQISQLLEQQVQSPVYFEDTVRFMQNAGIDTVIEIGPGKTLSGFIKKTAADIRTYCIEDCATLSSTLAALKGASA